MVLVNEALEGLKWKLGAWQGTSELKGLRPNVEKTKMVLSSKNAGKVTMEGKFLCAVYKKGVGSSSILCHICIAVCITHIVVLEVN